MSAEHFADGRRVRFRPSSRKIIFRSSSVTVPARSSTLTHRSTTPAYYHSVVGLII